VRYTKIIQRHGGRVALLCPAEIIPLLSGCDGIDVLIPTGSPFPKFELYAALLSLPEIVGTTQDSIPAEIPYLLADAQRVEHWHKELRAVPGVKVGICWQGSKDYANDRHRSIPLNAFAPLADIPGVSLISLQKGPGTEQLVGCPFPVIDFGDRLDAAGSFMDTAAIMQNLDLVISADTAPCHLAGALGRTVWVPLPVVHDWRWIIGREDTPWYPTMRLFRQETVGDWASLFQRIAQELRNHVGNS
jgi:hypothetical protein